MSIYDDRNGAEQAIVEAMVIACRLHNDNLHPLAPELIAHLANALNEVEGVNNYGQPRHDLRSA